MHKNKTKGTVFEYDVKHSLQMLCFDVFRAWSSIGTADLSAHPPWNPKKNFRGLLIQAKNQKNDDYLTPFETSHIDHLQQINSAMVCIFYKKNTKCMVKVWESREVLEFDEFILREYGIPCNYKELLRNYKLYKRPIHLYPVEKEIYKLTKGENKGKISERMIAPFTDLYAHDVWYPHVPETYKLKSIN